MGGLLRLGGTVLLTVPAFRNRLHLNAPPGNRAFFHVISAIVPYLRGGNREGLDGVRGFNG